MIEPLDLSNPDSFANGYPHDFFRQLRREAPVYWHEGEHREPDFPGEPGPGSGPPRSITEIADFT